jgi:hypothetical protein
MAMPRKYIATLELTELELEAASMSNIRRGQLDYRKTRDRVLMKAWERAADKLAKAAWFSRKQHGFDL